MNNLQNLADHLHAVHTQNSGWSPWLAVAEAAANYEHPKPEPIYPDCHKCQTKGSMRHTLTQSFCAECGYDGDDDEPEQQYQMLEAGEALQAGDQVNGRCGWRDLFENSDDDCHLGKIIGKDTTQAYPVGYYRRPIVETPVTDKIQTERNMALDAAVEHQQLLEKHKAIEESNKNLVDKLAKANRDLFAYGEFTTSVAKALGIGTYEISFKDVLDKIRIIQELWNSHIKGKNEKLATAATYIEGLERDLSFYVDATNAAIADSDFYRNELNKLQVWQNAVKNVVAR